MNAPQPAQKRLPAPPDNVLLKEAESLVSGVLGKSYVFNSRALFYRWLHTGGMKELVSAGAMQPINNDEWSALEMTVAMLRMHK